MSTSPALPRHLAVIMDGNGRWAKQRQRPRTLGHRAGARAVRTIVEHCLERGIPALTLFAFSSENWNRPEDEVGALMRLFLRVLESEVEELTRRQVHLRFIGERARFPEALRRRMAAAEAIHHNAPRLVLTLAAGYGGRADIAAAARRLAERVQAGTLCPEQIDESTLGQAMSLADLPPPDLFIRTGGERRISNFLLWQLAYTELWFTDVLWPDVDAALLDAALADYARRERRFGLLPGQCETAAVESR
ncbi:polyprenyl diphosphate synthase [Silanimonas sp.]|uniref:polyprenyl diphosphate synthase n=1 Tax=Silanimonas sp. TaxID=1929290 RepID=UPI001BC69864|nr:polyprenyl diphosphate synthase [Silanimonas sp.]MBS3896890.1 di-trans,poly-cis-decaprenylcistransferase [Silanimonas sp.]MBS3924779.1 di-trans,poly-cis-decaprenylcistransferase [Xanthomonadaceae bacterium]